MHKDSVSRTLLVATVLCIVCAVLVSSSVVALKPLQERNKALEEKKNILEAAGLMVPGGDIEKLFEQIEPRLVDLDTDHFTDQMDPTTFDPRAAMKNPELIESIPADKDIAKIRSRSRLAKVYLVKQGDRIETLILPVYGKGLWSTMYAFVALSGDGNTVKGVTFYDHGETPGLGGEVENPLWKNRWLGKHIYQNDQLAIRVIKGRVDPNRPGAITTMDGLGGATLTTRGVNNLIRYWLGEEGFAPFLRNFRTRGETHG